MEEDAHEQAAQHEKFIALDIIEQLKNSGLAGTGKTTLLKIFLDQETIVGRNILLLAPTGKARVRLGQQTGPAVRFPIGEPMYADPIPSTRLSCRRLRAYPVSFTVGARFWEIEMKRMFHTRMNDSFVAYSDFMWRNGFRERELGDFVSFVLHRQMNRPAPVAVAGRDAWLIDSEGKEYLDACSGAAVSALGHNDPAVAQAVADQMSRLSYTHTSFFSSEPAERLAQSLVEKAGEPFSHVFFTSSGSEAVEAAIKFVRQHFVEKGEPERRHVIGRWQSYHGNTLGALSAGGNKLRRGLYSPLLLDMHHIDACYAYRGQVEGESLDAYGIRMADQLEAKILELGSETVASFIVEPVVGATLGAVAAPATYFPRIREICDRYGVLLVFDEVMCGMGRLGSLFAFEHVGVRPDIVCIAKGLASGYQPIAAMLLAEDVVKPVFNGTGSFMHGHTYQAHPVTCAAAEVVLSKISTPEMLTRVREAGKRLMDGLRVRLGNSPHVGDIRGEGLFLAVEFVADAASKEPFPHTMKLNALIKREAMDRGLLVYAMGGTLDGQTGDHVLLAPPFIVSDEEIDRIVEVFAEASFAALDQVAPQAVAPSISADGEKRGTDHGI